MSKRKSIPENKIRRRKSALTRRELDIVKWNNLGNSIKAEIAKQDVENLKIKLGVVQ